jgi:hypothetical protein
MGQGATAGFEDRERRQAKTAGMGGKRGWQIRENDFWFTRRFTKKVKGFRRST